MRCSIRFGARFGSMVSLDRGSVGVTGFGSVWFVVLLGSVQVSVWTCVLLGWGFDSVEFGV